MPDIAISRHRLHFEQAGAGDALVFLHGLGSCGQDWLLQMPVLADRFHVIAPDLRGHGESARPQGRVCVTDLAGDVTGMMDALGVGRAHLVGLSLGGCVAQQIALDCPARIRSLTLVNTFARYDSGEPRTAILVALRMVILGTLGLPTQARLVAARLFPKPEQAPLRQIAAQRIAANDPATYRRMLIAIQRFDVRDRLGEIRCPTLVIAGERDTTVPLRAKRFLAAHISGARLEIVADSGHATPVDQPDAFNELLTRFLQSVS